MGIRNILFDLDGTLTNSKMGIVNSIKYALDKLHIEEKNESELESFIGPPLIESFRSRYHLNDEQCGQAVKYYREYYAVKGLFENELYEGIPTLMKDLFQNNYTLIVATSKPQVFAKQIIEHFQLHPYFKDIIGSNLDNTLTDKKELIALAIQRHGLKAEETLMIGDRKFDMIGSKHHQLTSVGVTYGFGSIEELQEAGADHIVHDCLQISNLISGTILVK